jgi:hypothetical protein
MAGTAGCADDVVIKARRTGRRRVGRLPHRRHVGLVQRGPAAAVPALDQLARRRRGRRLRRTHELVQPVERVTLRRLAERRIGGEQIVPGVERKEARAQERRRVAFLGEVAAVLRAAVAGHAGAGHVLLAAAVEVDRRKQRAIGRKGQELRERQAPVGPRRGRPLHRDAGHFAFAGERVRHHVVDLGLALRLRARVVADDEGDIVRRRLRGTHEAHQVQVHLVDVLGRHLDVAVVVGFELVLTLPVRTRDRLDHVALGIAVLDGTERAVIHARAQGCVLALVGEEPAGPGQAVGLPRLGNDHAAAHVAVRAVGDHLHDLRPAVRNLQRRLERGASGVTCGARRRHVDRLREALACHLQLQVRLHGHGSIERVVAELVDAQHRPQHGAVRQKQLHRCRRLQAEVLAPRATDTAIGQADVAEQAQVASRVQWCWHQREASVRVDRHRPAVAQRRTRRGATTHDVGVARAEFGQRDLAGQVGLAAEDGLAGGLVHDLHGHVGQVHLAFHRRAAARRHEGRVRAPGETQASGNPVDIGHGRCGMSDGSADRRCCTQRIGRDDILLLDESALAVGNGDVGEMQAGSVGHGPHRLGRVAILDRARGHAPLVLERVAVGVARFDAQIGLVGAAVALRAGAATAARQHEANQAQAQAGVKAARTKRVKNIHAQRPLVNTAGCTLRPARG